MIRRILLATVAGAAGLSLAAQPQSWWSGPQVTLLGSPSPDGAWLSFVEPSSSALAATLEEVVDFYDLGGRTNPDLDPEIRPLRLSAEEKANLAAFLRALNGTVRDGF